MWEKAERSLLKDKYIALLVKKYGHCTLKPRTKKHYFEDLVDAIIQQQLSMKAASAIFNRIKETISKKQKAISKKPSFAQVCTGASEKQGKKQHKWRADPTGKIIVTPENISLLTNEELRACGLSRAKIVYAKDLLEKVINGQLKILDLDKLPDKAIIEELTAVKGIGEWTAQTLRIFALGFWELFVHASCQN